MFRIGQSEELSYCKGVPLPTQVSASGLPVMGSTLSPQCRNFLNKSIESICDRHRSLLQERQMERIISSRIGLHTDFIDLNKLRKQQELEDIENRIGAFGGRK